MGPLRKLPFELLCHLFRELRLPNFPEANNIYQGSSVEAVGRGSNYTNTLPVSVSTWSNICVFLKSLQATASSSQPQALEETNWLHRIRGSPEECYLSCPPGADYRPDKVNHLLKTQQHLDDRRVKFYMKELQEALEAAGYKKGLRCLIWRKGFHMFITDTSWQTKKPKVIPRVIDAKRFPWV